MDFSTKVIMPKSDKANAANKRLIKKPMLYPEFQLAADIVKDTTWKDILISAARGNFKNKNIKYDGLSLIWTPSNARVKIPKASKQEVVKVFMFFYRKYVRTVSNDEIEAQKTRERLVMDKEIILTWNTCSKQLKQSRLFEYSGRMITRYNCKDPIDSRNELSGLLLLALNEKLLTEKTLTMKNNLVTDICGIKYNSKSKCWWLDRSEL